MCEGYQIHQFMLIMPVLDKIYCPLCATAARATKILIAVSCCIYFLQLLINSTMLGYSYSCQKVVYSENEHELRVSAIQWISNVLWHSVQWGLAMI